MVLIKNIVLMSLPGRAIFTYFIVHLYIKQP